MKDKEGNTPLVSIIMGIFNCADTLAQAIDCIIAQTYENWELIMCDDGSSDSTYTVAKDYQLRFENKIVLIRNDKNRGLNYTLNRCLKYAKGQFIARMDADDLCSPERFEKEIQVFKHEPNISIVSSDMIYFDETGVWGRISHPEYPQNIDFVYGTPFCHAPCMVKKEAYDAVGGYSVGNKLLRVEDYHLWIKMYAKGYSGKNIHLPLYHMRDDRNAYKRRKFKYRINEAYVRAIAVRKLKLPIYSYICILRPILVGLLPDKIYNLLHKKNLKA